MRILLALIVSLYCHTPFAANDYFPILDLLHSKAYPLHSETVEWMNKWRGMDVENQSLYALGELSGSTSVNVKINKLDPTDPKGYKSRGTFHSRNSAANPNTQIAYFNLAAIFGVDHLFRPSVRYELGSYASAKFRDRLLQTPMTHVHKAKNKKRILAEIATGAPLKGCLKAKKPDSARSLETIKGDHAPNSSHPVIRNIQASHPQPKQGVMLKLLSGYVGDEFELAREYSILMTFDAVFDQWDRYSGGNVGIRTDVNGRAHFYSTDNGGAEFSASTSRVERTLRRFSRFDRRTIENLRELHQFLERPYTGYLGYTDAQRFVVDLGLYYELSPQTYVERLKRNIALVLQRVSHVEAQYGANAFFN